MKILLTLEEEEEALHKTLSGPFLPLSPVLLPKTHVTLISCHIPTWQDTWSHLILITVSGRSWLLNGRLGLMLS